MVNFYEALFRFVHNSSVTFIDGAGPFFTIEEKQILVAPGGLVEVRTAVFLNERPLSAWGGWYSTSFLSETMVYGTLDLI